MDKPNVAGERNGPLLSGGAPVLLSNDDGSDADGVRLLAEAARAAVLGPLLIVTPSTDVSGAGTAVGAFAGQWLTAHHRPDLDDAQYELPVYPAAIVTLAAEGGFGPPPRLVLTGVNDGENCGAGLLASSTVGAALGAAPHGIPAVAVSAVRLPEPSDRPRWRAALAAILAGVDASLTATLGTPGDGSAGPHGDRAAGAHGAEHSATAWPYGGVLNVNLPAELPREPSGVRWCSVARYGAWAADVERRTTDEGDLSVQLRYASLDAARLTPHENTDTATLLRGEVALNWLRAPYGTEPDPAWQQRLLAAIRARWPRETNGADLRRDADSVLVVHDVESVLTVHDADGVRMVHEADGAARHAADRGTLPHPAD